MARFIPITNAKQQLPVDSFVFMLWEKGTFFVLLFVSPVWKCSHAWIFRDFYVRVQDVSNRSMRKLPFAISYRSDDKKPGLLMVMWLAGGENGGKAKNCRVQARSPGSGICASSSTNAHFLFWEILNLNLTFAVCRVREAKSFCWYRN